MNAHSVWLWLRREWVCIRCYFLSSADFAVVGCILGGQWVAGRLGDRWLRLSRLAGQPERMFINQRLCLFACISLPLRVGGSGMARGDGVQVNTLEEEKKKGSIKVLWLRSQYMYVHMYGWMYWYVCYVSIILCISRLTYACVSFVRGTRVFVRMMRAL